MNTSCESFMDYAYNGESALEGLTMKRHRFKIIYDKITTILKFILNKIHEMMSKNIILIVPTNVDKVYSNATLDWTDAVSGLIPSDKFEQHLSNIKNAVKTPSSASTKYYLSSLYRSVADIHKFIVKTLSPEQISNKYVDGKIDLYQDIRYRYAFDNAKTMISIINTILKNSEKVHQNIKI